MDVKILLHFLMSCDSIAMVLYVTGCKEWTKESPLFRFISFSGSMEMDCLGWQSVFSIRHARMRGKNNEQKNERWWNDDV